QEVFSLLGRAKAAVPPRKDGMLETIGAQVARIEEDAPIAQGIARVRTLARSDRPRPCGVVVQLNSPRRIVRWIVRARQNPNQRQREQQTRPVTTHGPS